MTLAKRKTVLVVGVNGLIGRNTAKFLRDNDINVRGVSRGIGEYQAASAMKADLAGIDLRFGDISDGSFSEMALDEVDDVVYAAGISGVAASFADPAASRQGMVAPWLGILQHARPGTRLVLMSSQLVYGPSRGRPFVETDGLAPASPYAANLVLMEQEGGRVAEQRLLEVVSLRLGNVFGEILRLEQPRSHGMVALMLRDLVMQGEIRLFGGGTQTVNLLYVDDLVEAISQVLARQHLEPLTVFNVSGEALTVRSIADVLYRGARTGRIVSVPWPAVIEHAVARDSQLDDSKFRSRFEWRRMRSVTAELERVARQSGLAGQPD